MSINLRKGVRDLLYSFAAIMLALVVAGVLLLLSGYNVWDAYYNLFYGAFGDIYNFGLTLVNMIVLIFAGLAVAIGFRGGLFNIGVEGQLYMGGLCAVLVTLHWGFLPGVLILPAAFVVAMLAGGAWAFIPGVLKAKTGAHEVVVTIMMNYIGILLTSFLVRYFFKVPGPVDQTARVPEHLRMAELIPTTRLTGVIFIALLMVFLFAVLLRHTRLGYEIETVGQSPGAAEYAGISVGRTIVLTMVISGAMGGLAGASITVGVLQRFITNFSPGYGFAGIAVAVLGRNRPAGIVPAALLFGALEAGGVSMQLFTRIPMDLMVVMQGLVILFVAAPELISGIGRTTGRIGRIGTTRTTRATGTTRTTGTTGRVKTGGRK